MSGDSAAAPRWRHCTDALSMVASDLSAQRQLHYPAAIAKGLITAAEAATGLRVSAAIATDWRRAVAVGPRVQTDASRAERIATLVAASARAAAIAARHPGDVYRAEYAELVETLLWWERRPLGIQWLVDTTLAMRAAASRRSGAGQEREAA